MNWKIPAGFAGFALLVSLLTGFISGVSPGAVFLRSLLWAALFGALGFGLLMVFNRFFPEMSELLEVKGGEEPGEKGEEVDIVLPDENPHAGERKAKSEDAFDDINSLDDDSGDIGAEFSEEAVAGEMDEKVKKAAKRRDENMDNLEEMNDPFTEVDDINSLPDLDKFSGSFSNFEDFDSPGGGGEMTSKPKESVDIAGVKQDPAKVAKALHTWIERDKEG